MHVDRIDAFGDPEPPASPGRESAGVVAEADPGVTGVPPDGCGVTLRGPGCCAPDVALRAQGCCAPDVVRVTE